MPIISQFVTALGPSTTALLSFALAIALGLLIGRINIKGVRLGVTGVLFSSLALSQVGVTFPTDGLPFVCDFALVLFMYALGLQIGPGFVASLRAEGVRLNILAAAALILAGVLAAVLALVMPGSRDAAAGVYAGAVNSTPALAGGQVVIRQVLAGDPRHEAAALAASSLSYAVTYPFGVVGPILLIALLRRVFRVRMDQERAALTDAGGRADRTAMFVDVEITSDVHAGRAIRELAHSVLKGIVVSRLYRADSLSVPRASTELRTGDIVRIVGEPMNVRRVIELLGRPSAVDLSRVSGEIRRADLVLTKAAVLRRPLRELRFRARIGVTIAQVNRAGVELIPHGGFTLKFGDQVVAVGPEQGVKLLERELGNEPDALNLPHLIPLFVGVVVGVVVGAIPLAIPGLPAPLRIGLAGGPFLAAIALSQLGSFGPMVWYMPAAANRMVQDLSLSIFLTCIGFRSGPGLLEHAAKAGPGLILAGAAITLVPVFLMACFARQVLRMNFVTLSGWIAGTMTSTPALQYANEDAQSDAPALAYASVAPLCELLPIIAAELLALLLR